MADFEDLEQKITLSYETNADDVAKKVNNLDNNTEDLAKSQEKVTKTSKDNVKGLEELGGGIGDTITSMKSMLKTMWAIVANPLALVVIAIVGALALLFKAFTSTNDGADKMQQIMAGVSAVVDILRDRFLKLASAIGKILTLDFAGAMKDGKEAVSGFGAEVEKEFKQAANAARALQEVEDAVRSLGVTRAKLNRDLAASKEIITDETASYADKKKAIDEVREAEGKQTEQELFNAKKKLQAIKLANSLSDTSDEDLQKEADAQSAVFKLQEEQSNNIRNLNKLDKRANSEESARLKAITDEKKAAYKVAADARKASNDKILADQKALNEKLKALAKEQSDAEQNLLRFNQDLNDKTEEEKLARQKERALQEIEILKQKGIDVESILVLNAEKFATLEDELVQKRAEEKAIRDKEIFDKEAEEKQKQYDADLEAEKKQNDAKIELAKSLENSRISITDKALGLFSLLAGKNKKLQKAAIIAEGAVGLARTIRSTAEGNAGALALGILQAGPIAGPAIAAPAITANTINGALSGATIIASTAKAMQALGGGGSLSAPSSGGAAGGGSASPQVSFQASSENQIGNAIATKTNDAPPIQAFVVSSDVTTAQALDRNKITANSIG